MIMKTSALFHLSLLLFPFLASAATVSVSVDEDGVIQPQPARDAIARASSAVVKVNIAEAKAETLTNVQRVAVAALQEADRILTSRTDYAIISLTAAGVKDAVMGSATDSEGKIDIVDNLLIDRQSDPDNVRVTLTWQYVQGSFSSPRILASAQLATNSFEAVEITEPMQIEWGTNASFRATAMLPVDKYGSQAFLKVDATPDAPVDDGQVFDIYSDGTDYWVDLVPTRRYRMRIVSGRICTILAVE